MNIVVGIADMRVSDDPDVTLVTRSLGSCIGLAVYDPAVRVGGILHYMLPESELDPDKARRNPSRDCDQELGRTAKERERDGQRSHHGRWPRGPDT